jgi:hypothetical protein
MLEMGKCKTKYPAFDDWYATLNAEQCIPGNKLQHTLRLSCELANRGCFASLNQLRVICERVFYCGDPTRHFPL